jgi:hypothetical protein
MGMAEGDVSSAVQELVNGAIISPADVNRLGVVRITGPTISCTGTLVRGDAVVTTWDCASAGVDFTIGTQVRNKHPTLSNNPMRITDTPPAPHQLALVRLDSAFNLAHPNNPDAPFFRAISARPTSTFVGNSIFCTGTGTGQLSNPSNFCSAPTETGVPRSGLFTAFNATSPPSTPSEFFEVRPQSGMQPLGGDLGGSCMVGDVNNGSLVGVLTGTSCGNWSMYGATTGWADTGIVANVGIARSPKALYAINGGVLTEFWHVGQTSSSSSWLQNNVGSGWTMRHVVAIDSAMYAIDNAGVMRWYRHDGQYGVGTVWSARSGMAINTGWNFTNISARSTGEIITVDSTGMGRWYQHNAHPVGDYADGGLVDFFGNGLPQWAPGSGTQMGVIPAAVRPVSHVAAYGMALEPIIVRSANGNLYQSYLSSSHQWGPMLAIGSIPNVVDMMVRKNGSRTFVYYTDGTGGLFQREYLGPGNVWGPTTLVGSGFTSSYRFANSGRTN